MTSCENGSSNDKELIDSIYTNELIEKDDDKRTHVEDMVYKIISYNNEIGSGEDFIQWFSWTEPNELENLIKLLQRIGANKSANICRKAIAIAFPKGIPKTKMDYDEFLYDLELGDEDEEYPDNPNRAKVLAQLHKLAMQQIALDPELTACLAKWIRTNR